MPDSLTIERLISEGNDLPVMPGPILRVMHLASVQDTSAAQLAEAIGLEPALSARVLRFANSAYYGLPGAVTTISSAVVLLGIKTVRNLAMVAASHAWFSNTLSASSSTGKKLWEKAIGTAAAADAVAAMRCPEISSEAFCVGLLHDLGKIVLACRLKDAFELIEARALESGISTFEAETSVLGFDHTQVGEGLAKSWNLPQTLTLPIRYHHNPDACEPPAKLVDIVHVADWLYLNSNCAETAEIEAPRCISAFERVGIDSNYDFESLIGEFVRHQQQLQHLSAA